MMEIQIAFNRALNWNFVSTTPKSAAQVIQTLPDVLKFLGPEYKGPAIGSTVRQLRSLNTLGALGYITTIAICTYPRDRVEKLRVEMNTGTAWMWRNPQPLAYNMSMEINTAIDILVGSTLDTPAPAPGAPGAPAAPNDVFNNNGGGGGSDSTPSQRGATAGIAVGAIFISAAYGGAMFIIARRYKKKKQAHQRTSSLNSSEMRQTGSPALMGGALLSRDFTSSYGGVGSERPGPRDSHGSGRSNMNNSGRTAYISAPVAAENSLGWN